MMTAGAYFFAHDPNALFMQIVETFNPPPRFWSSGPNPMKPCEAQPNTMRKRCV